MDFRDRLKKLFALLGSKNAGESANAKTKIDEILVRNRKTWNDLTELLLTGSAGSDWNADDDDGDAAPSGETTGPDVSALDLTHHLLVEHLELKSYEYVAMALWILHTHVFDRYMVSPRLALISPVRGCGKTSALSLLVLLCARARKDDGITAAAIFRIIDREHPTLLLDEADNLGLDHNGILRSVLNSGHRKGGSHTRVIKDLPKRFSTYAPMAIASIGRLPLPVTHRSVVINMERSTRDLRRIDEGDPGVNHSYGLIRAWARDVKLQPDPALPSELRNRPADNWRVLIAVADSFGKEWGARARAAAITFSHMHHDEDAGVTLLNDIRRIFNDRNVDRLTSATIVEDLVAEGDSVWSEWRGIRDDRQPRPLSQAELARLLAPFFIRPKTIWPQRRNLKTKSKKGYLRSQFERAWRAYCDDSTGTPAQRKHSRRLR